MKIRQQWLLKSLAYAGAWSMRLWMSTVHFRYHPLGRNLDPNQPDLKERYIYAFWHENMLLPERVDIALFKVWLIGIQIASERMVAEMHGAHPQPHRPGAGIRQRFEQPLLADLHARPPCPESEV